MKKFGILVVMLSFLLTGCVRIPSLQDMAVVQGVGVDYEDGEYQLTLQVFSAEGSGGQTILDPSQQNASTITCRGESLMDALSQTSLSQGRRFFLGHDRLLVLGDGTQALPLSQLLKSLSGSLSLREDVTVVTAENAASLLETEVNQGLLPALTLEQTVENAAANGQVPHVRLLDLNRSLSESWRSCLIPRLQLTDEEEGSLKTVEIVGADLYNGGEYSTFLSESSAAGILMLQNRLDQLALTVELPDFGQVGLELYRFQSSLRPTDTGWKLTASGSASVAEAPAQLEENRTVTHSVIGMSMSVGMGSAAMTAGVTSVESYTALENGVVTTWQKDPATGTWSTAQASATYEQMTAANGTLMLSGISAAGAPVTTDGQVYRFTGTMDASLMSDMADVLESSGISADGSFPVVVEIDAATFYPSSIVIGMPNLTMPEMPGMTATATVAVVYDGFNQFDAIALPGANAA